MLKSIPDKTLYIFTMMNKWDFDADSAQAHFDEGEYTNSELYEGVKKFLKLIGAKSKKEGKK